MSAREISAPVASPPACAMRSRWWPPSRVSVISPPASRSNSAPSATSSRTRSGPSVTSTRTASASHSPTPGDEGVVEVLLRGCPPGRAQRRCRPAPTAVEPARENGLRHEQHPVDPLAQAQRAVSPAMPDPTTTTSAAIVHPGAGALRRRRQAAPAERSSRLRPRRGRAARRRRRRRAATGSDDERGVVDEPGRADRAATASRASPRYHSGTSASVCGSDEHEVVHVRARLLDEHLARGRGARPTAPEAGAASLPARSARDRAERRPRGSDSVRYVLRLRQRQAVGLAHRRHRPMSTGKSRSRTIRRISSSCCASFWPKYAHRRPTRCSSLPTTVSTPSKWPGRDAPSEDLVPSGAGRRRDRGRPSG